MPTSRRSLPRPFVFGALASLLLLALPAQAAYRAPATPAAAQPQAIQAFLSGRAWSDTNQDGIQDAGEPAVAGVTINLLDGTGTVLATRTTDGSGVYLFDSLGAGEYAVQFIPPGDESFSPQGVGSNDAADSDVIPATGVTPVITLGATDSIPHFDAGLIAPTGEEPSPEPQAPNRIFLPSVRAG